MREQGCHHVPVVDGARVLGMLSAHDLVKALVLRRPFDDAEVLGQSTLKQRRVEEVMQRNVLVLPQSSSVLDAARALSKGEVHALPVVTLDGALCGIVTSTDLIEALADALEHPVASADTDAPASGPAVSDLELRALRDLLAAAVRYLESGRGDLEHGRLLQAVNRAREATRERTASLL